MSSYGNFLKRIIERLTTKDPLEELIARGLTVGKNFYMQNEVLIDKSHCQHITIGDDVTLAPRVYILAHDASTKRHLGYTKIGKVTIGDRVFIGAASVILPGVTIGSDVVIGVGSVVTRDIPHGAVAAGVPAKVIGTLDEYLLKRKQEMERFPCFGEEYTIGGGVTKEMIDEMNRRMKERFGFIV
jgi:maltose O-acetyltransferase